LVPRPEVHDTLRRIAISQAAVGLSYNFECGSAPLTLVVGQNTGVNRIGMKIASINLKGGRAVSARVTINNESAEGLSPCSI
jgi:hypothetical protein